MIFQLFGSEDSLDYDVMVFVDEIPVIIDDGHTLCKSYNKDLSKILTDKELNTNLAVIKNGIVVNVFKGTPDEVNNSLFYTYDNHEQIHKKFITKVVDRDFDRKLLRVFRNIISYFSRSELRVIIKSALRGDLNEKIEALKLIDFNEIRDINKKDSMTNIYKIISFQYGQLFSLIDDVECDSYTKSGVIKNYADLSNMLRRGNMLDSDFITLNRYKDRLIKFAQSRVKIMQNIKEY